MRNGPNRLSICLMVRDELDIVPAFIAHHARLSGRLVVVDHRSSDGTRQYLEGFADSDVDGCGIEVLRYDEPSFQQSVIATALMRREFRRGADWVAVLDADEFIDFESSDALLEALEGAGEVAVLSWVNIMPASPILDFARIPEFDPTAAFVTHSAGVPPTRGKVVVSRAFWRRHRRLVLPNGNHTVRARRSAAPAPARIVGRLLHVPARSPLQVALKRKNIVTGRAAIDQAWKDRAAHHEQLSAGLQVLDARDEQGALELMRQVVLHYEATSGIGETGISLAEVRFPALPAYRRQGSGQAQSTIRPEHLLSATDPVRNPTMTYADRWTARVRNGSVTLRPARFRRAREVGRRMLKRLTTVARTLREVARRVMIRGSSRA